MRTPATAVRDDFDGFYLAHFGDTVTLSYAYTADLAEAQDIAQEAFSRAWQRWGSVAQYENPAAWVRRVAYNLAHSRWRRLKTAAAYLVRQRLEDEPEPNPDHVALVAALRKLPRAQREAIVWHHIADLPVEDVAHQLQAPVATVKTWLRRGRRTMAGELGIDVRSRVTTPPPAEVEQLARKRQRTKATALAAAIAVLVALTLGAFQFLKPAPEIPVTPSPSPSRSPSSPPPTVDSNDPMRTVDWNHATITFTDLGGCATGRITFAPWPAAPGSAWHQFTEGTGIQPPTGLQLATEPGHIALGDLTGDGRAEAVVLLICNLPSRPMMFRAFLSALQLDDTGRLVQIDWMEWTDRKVTAYWIGDRMLHVDGASERQELIGAVHSWAWNGSTLTPVDPPARYKGIGSIDLAPVAHLISCQGLPAVPPARARLVFGATDRIISGDREWNLSASRGRAVYEERGRTGNPYLVLNVGCGQTGDAKSDHQRVVLDWTDNMWRAIAVEPPELQVSSGPTR